jgi:hypothetical protein
MVVLIEFLQNWASCHTQSAHGAKHVSSFKFVSGVDQLFKFLVAVGGACVLQFMNT